ncbi:MAG: general secretion pathway protein GspK [Desulfobacterales bacterium]|nr:general secretion pathway protein GspK [Desulfobacterales bacterium]
MNSEFKIIIFNEKGYALPLALAISFIILLISISIASSVRSKIKCVFEIQNRTQAYIKSYSAINEVFYDMTTSVFNTYSMDIYENGKVSKRWNLYGNPIEIEKGITVKIRHASGMISPIFQLDYLRSFIEKISNNTEKTAKFIDSFLDWQDADNLKHLNGSEAFDYKTQGFNYAPRNFYIQVKEEMKLILGFDEEIYDKIKDEILYWGASVEPNYLLMSENLLRTLFSDSGYIDKIIELRSKDEISEDGFEKLADISIENDGFFASTLPYVVVDVSAEVGESVDSIQTVIFRQQTLKAPFTIIEWRR